MARRKPWSELSDEYRNRLKKAGITKAKHERGVSIKSARGHRVTPEHGMQEALKKPARFRKYIQANPQQEAILLNDARDQAYANSRNRLGNYHSYNPGNVTANIYGGIRGPQHRNELEHTEVDGMTYDEAMWTARADTESLRSRASDQSHTNPWWYH
jgi:hypothetical protein